MDFKLDQGWRILPVGGDTGMAYMGVKQNEKLFLKRNTSPFLAALSLEEVTPKLIWTKRMTSGDTLTAQEWLNGRSLQKDEMKSKMVSKMLFKIHHSSLLLEMLKKVGGQIVTPEGFLRDYLDNLPKDLKQQPILQQSLAFLQKNQPTLPIDQYEVCHGDLNHKNWLLAEDDQLYLVDWDCAIIADPTFDLSMLMCQYVPRHTWKLWLKEYGVEPTSALLARINWYMQLNLLLTIKKNYQRGRFHEMNQDIYLLTEIFELNRK